MKIYYIPSKEFNEVKERLEKAEDTIKTLKQCVDILFFATLFVLFISILRGCCA